VRERRGHEIRSDEVRESSQRVKYTIYEASAQPPVSHENSSSSSFASLASLSRVLCSTARTTHKASLLFCRFRSKATSELLATAEDEEDNRRIVRDPFTSVGYEIIEAVTGEAGVMAAAIHLPDLISWIFSCPATTAMKRREGARVLAVGESHVPQTEYQVIARSPSTTLRAGSATKQSLCTSEIASLLLSRSQ
jgi:hypothetical protein